MSIFNNFNTIQTELNLSQEDIIDSGKLFDNIHTKVINGEVRNFNRGEYNNYYNNRNKQITFKRPISILIYWNFKPIIYDHQTEELIYLPKTTGKQIMDIFDTIRRENKSFIYQSQIQYIFEWHSKYLNDSWGNITITKIPNHNINPNKHQ